MVDPLKISYQFYDLMDEDIREVGQGNVHVLYVYSAKKFREQTRA